MVETWKSCLVFIPGDMIDPVSAHASRLIKFGDAGIAYLISFLPPTPQMSTEKQCPDNWGFDTCNEVVTMIMNMPARNCATCKNPWGLSPSKCTLAGPPGENTHRRFFFLLPFDPLARCDG